MLAHCLCHLGAAIGCRVQIGAAARRVRVAWLARCEGGGAEEKQVTSGDAASRERQHVRAHVEGER